MYHYTIEGQFISNSELTPEQIDSLIISMLTQVQEPVDIFTNTEEEYETSSVEIRISLEKRDS
jgi:hypothetical protein